MKSIKKLRLFLSIFCCIALFSISCGNGPKVEETKKGTAGVVPPTKPIVNVYIENSGSMFGYISTGNNFDRSISSLLTTIQVSDYADKINLFYINSRAFKQSVDIPTFIRNTNRHNTTNWPGNLGETDMCSLFNMVTSSVNNNSISIFVSDCIFSPGKGVDANRYIGTEKDCITLKINEKLKSKDLAFIVYRLLSEFNGKYYDCQDNSTLINNQRPYFIWIIGEKENIASFKQKIPTSKIEGQLKNSFTIFKSESNTKYAVQLHPQIGSFERKDQTTIIKSKKDRDSGKFMFSIAANFSSLLVDESYLTNSQNYELNNPNYSIEVIKKHLGNYTHMIRVTTTANIISPTVLTIQLKNRIPDWVDEFSDESCANINSKGMMQRTFGFKQIIHGIYAAYNYNDDALSEIKININQKP